MKGRVHSRGVENEARQLLVKRIKVEWKGEANRRRCLLEIGRTVGASRSRSWDELTV